MPAATAPATPLPLRKVAVLMCVSFSDAMSVTMLFPVVPFLVRTFPEVDESKPEMVSYLASVLASCFNFSQFLSGFLWGSFSDKYGRRPVLMFGLFGSIVGIIVFGLASTLVLAITSRCLHGLLNNNSGVARTYMREITDQTNQARGMSLFGTFWGIGAFVGPAVGGFLSFPGDKWPQAFPPDSLFVDHPFLLPSLGSAGVAFGGLLLGWCSLEETLQDPRPLPFSRLLRCVRALCTAPIRRWRSPQPRVRKSKSRRARSEGDMVELVATAATLPSDAAVVVAGDNTNNNNDHSDGDGDGDGDGRSSGKASAVTAQRPGFFSAAGRAALGKLLRKPGIAICLCIYTAISFMTASLHELFPLWAASPRTHGGLGFTGEQIGSVMMTLGVFVICYSLLVFPLVERRLGSTTVFRVFSGFYAPVCIFTPWLFYLVDKPRAMWACLVVLVLTRGTAGPSIFTAAGVLISNSSQSDVGALNGVATSLAALARAIGPVSAGTFLGWGQSSGLGYPLNFHLPFVVLGMVALGSLFVSFRLPEGMDMREEDRVRVLPAPGDDGGDQPAPVV